MKNFLIAFTVFLVWSFFGLWLYSWLQSDTGSIIPETEGINPTEVIEADLPSNDENELSVVLDTLQKVDTLAQSDLGSIEVTGNFNGLKAINAQGEIVFGFDEGISIIENSSEIYIPESLVDLKNKISSYLIENPDIEVHINSLYSASENFETPNLGIQRAEQLKTILLESDVPNEKIVIKPIIKGIDFNEEGLFDNSISIVFKTLDLERVAELKTKLPDMKTVYPRFSNSGILINDNLRKLLVEVKEVVKANSEVKIELVGHTDNIGNDFDNYKMGLNYSKQVEWYLVAKGAILNENIKASSKGETEPIESNNSESGRIANRRIEVIFY